MKSDAARSKVRWLAALSIEHAATDIAQQARQQCHVHLLERRRRRVQAPGLLGRKGRQLSMHFDPLAHAARAQVLAPQIFGQLAVRFLVADRLMDEVPQFHQCQEVTSFVRVAPVRLIGRILRLERPLARILDRQSASDDQHLGHALLLARCEQHVRSRKLQTPIDRAVSCRYDEIGVHAVGPHVHGDSAFAFDEAAIAWDRTQQQRAADIEREGGKQRGNDDAGTAHHRHHEQQLRSRERGRRDRVRPENVV